MENYWFIRLGSKGIPKGENLHRILAEDHNLITIGYGIEENIIGKDKSEIRKYLANRGNLTTPQVAKITDLINKFINEINEDDIIFSPAYDGSNKVRKGKIIGDCGTVKSILKDEQKLATIFGEQGKEIEGVKPAFKVKWENELLPTDDFPPELQKELDKRMLATVTRLNYIDKEYKRIKFDVITTPFKDIYSLVAAVFARFSWWIAPIIVSAIVSSTFPFILDFYSEDKPIGYPIWIVIGLLLFGVITGIAISEVKKSSK